MAGGLEPSCVRRNPANLLIPPHPLHIDHRQAAVPIKACLGAHTSRQDYKLI